MIKMLGYLLLSDMVKKLNIENSGLNLFNSILKGTSIFLLLKKSYLCLLFSDLPF